MVFFQNTDSQRKTITLLLLVIVLVVAFIAFLIAAPEDDLPSNELSPNREYKKVEHAVNKNIKVEAQEGAVSNYPKMSQNDAVKELAVHEYDESKWKTSRGYFSDVDIAVYETYGDEVIQSLAFEGDLIALHVLAKKYDKAGDSRKAKELRMVSAVRGSTSALIDVASEFQVNSWNKKLNKEQRNELIKRMLVNAEVAARRGDKNGIVMGLLELKNNNIVLSSKDTEWIQATANEVYQKLEMKREELGLDKFDNTPNKLMEFTLNHMISTINSKSDHR